MMLGNWENFRVICGNHGDDVSHEMHIHEGPHSLFYSCPEYKSIFGKENQGRSCNNRINLVDYEWMINHISGRLYDDAGSVLPICGYTCKHKGITFEVINQEEEKLTVKMLNQRAISK